VALRSVEPSVATNKADEICRGDQSDLWRQKKFSLSLAI
jgi:hypothetical protein